MMQRIDTFLVDQHFVESREQAKRLILAGAVTVNGNAKIKPGHRIPPDAAVAVAHQQKYVSRGGFKLEKALRTFDINLDNRVALDIGASTGGFTDCLLQHGAHFVYAIDVGYGQLAWKLRTHPQVHPIEKTNIRYLTPAELTADTEHSPSVAVIDVSFISLRTVLPNVIKLLAQQGTPGETDYDIVALLKPQFEAGKAHVKKGGVVPDKHVHIQTINTLNAFVTEKLGAAVRDVTYSPIHKQIRNIEYLIWLTPHANPMPPQQSIEQVVADAHEHFEG